MVKKNKLEEELIDENENVFLPFEKWAQDILDRRSNLTFKCMKIGSVWGSFVGAGIGYLLYNQFGDDISSLSSEYVKAIIPMFPFIISGLLFGGIRGMKFGNYLFDKLEKKRDPFYKIKFKQYLEQKKIEIDQIRREYFWKKEAR